MDGEKEFESNIWPIRAALKFIGCWPLTPKSSLFEILHHYVALTAVYTAGIVMAFGVINDMRLNRSDIDEATEGGLVFMECLLTCARAHQFTVHSEDVLYVIGVMRKDWIKSTEEDKRFLRTKSRLTFGLATLFIVLLTLCVSSYATIGVVMFVDDLPERVVLPFRGDFFFDYSTGAKLYIVCTLNMLCGLLGGETMGCATSFSIVMAMHGASKFTIAQQKFERLKCSDSKSIKDLAECVKYHRECIRYADAVENIINVLNLTHVILTTCFLAIAGYQVTSSHSRKRLLKHLIPLNIELLDLFLLCYGGDELLNKSEGVRDSIYLCDWIGGRLTTGLQIVMSRCKKPSSITAAKFYDMRLESYTTILQSAFSYYTLLRALRHD